MGAGTLTDHERAEADRKSTDPVLKPCPCCAGQRLEEPNYWSDRGLYVAASRPMLDYDAVQEIWTVICYGCGLQTANFRKRSDALKAWNQRTPPATLEVSDDEPETFATAEEVFQRPSPEGSVPAGAIQSKRVTLSSSSSTPSRRIVQS